MWIYDQKHKQVKCYMGFLTDFILGVLMAYFWYEPYQILHVTNQELFITMEWIHMLFLIFPSKFQRWFIQTETSIFEI